MNVDQSPFLDPDERLALRVSSELVQPLTRWKRGWSQPIAQKTLVASPATSFLEVGGRPVEKEHSWNAAWHAAERLVRAVHPNQRWNLRSIEQILRDLVAVLESKNAFMSSLWVAEPDFSESRQHFPARSQQLPTGRVARECVSS